MRILKKSILAVALATLLFGCGKPFVGLKVNPYDRAFCRIYSLPAECTIHSFKDMIPHVTITQLNGEGDYLIDGYFDPTKGSIRSFRNIMTHQSEFRMIFVNNNTIVDNKSISMRETDLSGMLRFSFEYHSDVSIDAVAFNINIVVID